MTMRIKRLKVVAGFIAALCFMAAAPAQAQFFWVSPDNSGAPVTGAEPNVGIPLPGATSEEQSGALVLAVRTGLNTAALQCQFEPMLLSVENYNGTLAKHEDEFVASYRSVEAYFKRTGGKTWQSAFDTYRTRLYNYFATVNAQYTFCQTASKVGAEALNVPRGGIANLARFRMHEMRNSLIFRGEQLRVLHSPRWLPLVLPNLSEACWDRNDELKKKCRSAYQEAISKPRGLTYY